MGELFGRDTNAQGEQCTFCPRRSAAALAIAKISGKPGDIAPHCVTRGPVPATIMSMDPVEIGPGFVYIDMTMQRTTVCPSDLPPALVEEYVDTMAAFGAWAEQEPEPGLIAPSPQPPEAV
jgi:hypothetical protein